jgi:hypothetical protein
LDALVQNLHLVLVVPLQLAELDYSVVLVELGLVGQLFEKRLVRAFHLLLLVEDVLELIDECPDFLGVGVLCLC